MPIFRALSAALGALADFLEYIGLSLGALGSLLGDLTGLNKIIDGLVKLLKAVFSFDLNLCSLIKNPAVVSQVDVGA